MAKLIFSSITSLDLFANDERGEFDWAVPDDEVHAFANALERSIGTALYGRRMYETMRVWETLATSPAEPLLHEYAQMWRAADKVVFSATLEAVTTPRTRLERNFDAGVVRELVATATKDVSISGPTLAAQAFAAGLVDEVHLFLNPVLIGGGTRALPEHVRVGLELIDEHRFGNGVVHLHHRVLR